ncbi:histone deacetylase family protein [Rhodovulum sulfidophilum]|uniref:histone deacetylase family protein n=1 Tax=Rhodovulum sulfidophilum TaxID=35806 RepID=UPI001F41C075|nr:histone deacetylase family protein [Rhodovulum sulfidophilum]MCE8439917.1 histone deacetylase family protein [Rhodovulum sulfidophilum]MCE8470953.1 histone deacetylase family protein [Rhodovulum sulfidophilum]
MTTAFLTHPDGLDHATPPGHAECADRLRAVTEALTTEGFAGLLREEAPLADEAELLRAHPQGYIDAVKAAIPAEGTASLDPDTHVSPGSFRAALRALGGTLRAVDMVMAGAAANAFVAMRPPGHHAEAARAMGFCLFSNIAIAAKYALDRYGLARVAVVDFDVHHGNGTQDLLWSEPRTLFVSSHQMPLYPGTGEAAETGAADNVLNLPLAPRSDGRAFRAAFEAHALPRLEAFAPELVLVSAGFDAHAADPLAELAWRTEDFAWITHRLCDIAETHSGGRLVSTLEGGYDLEALGASAAAHVAVLMERGA